MSAEAPDPARERILTAALKLFLDAGYEQTTVAKIREASGVSNGALFHRFASKEAIAAALYLDAIRSFQAAHWKILEREPGSLREAVGAIVSHQLRWTQANPDAARFIYDRGQLDWSADAAAELSELNRAVVAAYRSWLAPLVAGGELRELPPGLFAAIVAGPTHQVAQHWLQGERKRPLTSFAEPLIEAAWAGVATPEALRGAPLSAVAPAPRLAAARVRIELLDAEGRVVGRQELSTELS